MANDDEVENVDGEAAEFSVRQFYKRQSFMVKNKATGQEESVMYDFCQLPKDNSASSGVCGTKYKYTSKTGTGSLHKHLRKKHASEPLTQSFLNFCNKIEKEKPVILFISSADI